MRNDDSHFAQVPRADIQRSRFNRPSTVKTSFDAGDLVPFYLDEVLPGDTFKVSTSKVVRMQPLVAPIMDNIYLDTYYFFVPARLCWQHWKEFMGENTTSAWLPDVIYSIPLLKSPPETGWTKGTIADYFGLPTGVPDLEVNALPFRAYSLICNDWFRDENLVDPLDIPLDEATVVGSNGNNYVTDVAKGGAPFVVAKLHDYFTSALPSPQKGAAVTIPVAEAGKFRVVAGNDPLTYADLQRLGGNHSMQFTFADFPDNNKFFNVSSRDLSSTSAATPQLRSEDGVVSGGASTTFTQTYPSNLIAISDGAAQAASINALRLAFQLQKFLERDARGGTRYIEMLKAHFGVSSPDARLQRTEYLGGDRIPININQVTQTSETGTTPQGNPTGMSLTSNTHSDFTKSFTEHGYVIGVMCARYRHTYQQGLERLWSRRDRIDFYFPVFANIGEQSIKNKEIFCDGSSKDDEIFGYQEAWAEYRYKPSKVTGEMRSNVSTSLDLWHLADYYSELPLLGQDWISEDKSVLDRALAVSSRVSHQFFADILVDNVCTRPMPMYSVPGLIDHH